MYFFVQEAVNGQEKGGKYHTRIRKKHHWRINDWGKNKDWSFYGILDI